MLKKYRLQWLIILNFMCVSLVTKYSIADNLPLGTFPLNNYPQQTSTWFNADTDNYNLEERLLSDSYQNKKLVELK